MSDYDPDHMAEAVRIIAGLNPTIIRSDEELMRLPLNAVVLDALGSPWVLLEGEEDGVTKRRFFGIVGPYGDTTRTWMMLGPVIHLSGFWEREATR